MLNHREFLRSINDDDDDDDVCNVYTVQYRTFIVFAIYSLEFSCILLFIC